MPVAVTIDLSEVKSAVTVTAADEIAAMLADRDKEFQKANANVQLALTHTTLRETDDGMAVQKRSAQMGTSDELKDLTPEAIKTLAVKAGVEWRDDYSGRVKNYWASDARVDRHGDIVEQSWLFDDFVENPLLLSGHEWHKPPIGAVIEQGVKQRDSKKYTGPALALACLFAAQDTYAWADTCFRLVKAGFMRTGSVGMYPGEIIYVENEDERKKLGLGRWGVIMRNNSLVEFSAVTVPANVGAHLRSVDLKSAKTAVQPGDISILREIVRLGMRDQHRSTKAWRDTDVELRDFWAVLHPDAKKTLPDATDIDTSVLTQKNAGDADPTNTNDRQLLLEIHKAVNKLNERVFGPDSKKGDSSRTGRDHTRKPSLLKHMRDRMSERDS